MGDDRGLPMEARERATHHDGDGAQRVGVAACRYVPAETEDQVGGARSQDGLAQDTEEAPVGVGIPG